jgi:multicomponent Na+:H+ antiporter subunit F
MQLLPHIADWVSTGSLVLLALCLLASFVRVLAGPRLADRVIAVDLLAYTAVGMMGLWAVITDQSAYIDAALVLALIAFLGTVAMARYIERRTLEQPRGRV